MTGNTNGSFDILPEHWKSDEINNLCHFIVDCLHSTPVVVGHPTGYYMIRTSDVRDGNINLDSARHVTKEVYTDRVQRGVPAEGDIVITREAPLGEVGRIPPGVKICLGQRLIHYRPDKDRVEPRFLLYTLLSPLLKAQFLANMGTGSIVDNLRMGEARKLKIPLPPLSEQREIAHVLGTLDDKIELNRRMNATLEAIARAIFKSWFVDFDPVHAKGRGEQPYGMDAETAALFPDSFEDSELGPIPAGWGVGQLEDMLVLQRGFDLPTSKRVDGPYPVLAASGPSGFHNEFKVRGPGVTTGRSGVIGNVFFVHGDFWPLNTSLWVKEFRVAGPLYAYHLLQKLELASYNAGSAVPTLNRNHIHSLPMPVPPVPLIRTFENFVGSLFSMIKQNEQQSATLAALRDALLPKLISGELRVSELEVQRILEGD